jgi:hypothetical protein
LASQASKAGPVASRSTRVAASSGPIFSRNAAIAVSASGVEMVTVGLGMPEYGICPVSLTLLKNAKSLK